MGEVVTLPALTSEEDTFCLAIIEYGGNIPAAMRAAFGEDVTRPLAKGQELLARPEIAKRVMNLTKLVDEQALISLGSHLVKLAEIRDLAIDNKQLKTALAAEQARGQVAGFYNGKAAADPKNPEGKAAVNIFLGQATPASVDAWALRQGKTAVIIENGS